MQAAALLGSGAAAAMWAMPPLAACAPRPHHSHTFATCAPPAAGGMTLQQILQQYSSSGYKSRGASSRRGSMEIPAGRRSMDAGSMGGSLQRESVLSRDSILSQSASDAAWLGDN